MPLRRACRNHASRDARRRSPRRGARLMAATGTLLVVKTSATGESETFIRITADGDVRAYNGHVDLGTGVRTALGQIVADEL
ncbi:MAG: molybdopterin-dependent oxidoreductase, partial [Bradyrhizobium sp.]|nr:molybdopterin-dependent oxidoreductase [Bradyrhizobium sp.]